MNNWRRLAGLAWENERKIQNSNVKPSKTICKIKVMTEAFQRK
jgi:hypothetical protein